MSEKVLFTTEIGQVQREEAQQWERREWEDRKGCGREVEERGGNLVQGNTTIAITPFLTNECIQPNRISTYTACIIIVNLP